MLLISNVELRKDGRYPPLLSNRTSLTLLVLIMLAGAVLRIWGLQFGLALPFSRPDEEVIVDAALAILRDPNPHFFDWPTLFIYLNAAAFAALFAAERAIGGAITGAVVAKASFEPVLHLIARTLSVTAGIATIAVLLGAARELFSRRVALLAAAFIAVAFLHVRDSHFGLTDVPATFLTVCAFWAGLRCATKGVTIGHAALAGALCGLSASTKYNAGLVLLPAVIAILGETVWNRPRSIGLAVRAMAALLLCTGLGFLAGTPYALLDHHSFLAAVTGVSHHLSGGHVVMARGWQYHATFTFRYGLGLPLLVAACAGAGWLVVRQPWTAALVLAFPLPYYLILGSGLTVFVRYMVPMVPFLCLTAAVAVDRLAEYIGQSLTIARARDAATVAMAAIIGLPTIVQSVAFDRLMTKPDTRVIAGDWIASRFPAGASMYQSGFGYSHVEPKPAARYPQYDFREQAHRFEREGNPIDAPDLIVVVDSPVGAYTQTPPQIPMLVAADYLPVIAFDGISAAGAAGALYDQEDAFFAPFSGIEKARRPGPNIRVFQRRSR